MVLHEKSGKSEVGSRKILPPKNHLLPPAKAGDELSSLLDGAAPYLGDLLLPQLLSAALEVEHGGPAHRHGARVADGRGSRPAPERDQLHHLPGQGPKPEARGQYPE